MRLSNLRTSLMRARKSGRDDEAEASTSSPPPSPACAAAATAAATAAVAASPAADPRAAGSQPERRAELRATSAPEALVAQVLLDADLLLVVFEQSGLRHTCRCAGVCRVWRAAAACQSAAMQVLELVESVHAPVDDGSLEPWQIGTIAAAADAAMDTLQTAQLPSLGPFAWTRNFLMGQAVDEEKENIFFVDTSVSLVKKVRLRDLSVSKSVHFLLSENMFNGAGGWLRYPQGLAVHGRQVFVADLLNSRVVVFDVDFEQYRAFKLKRASNGMSASPYGLAVHKHVLYVADCSGSRVLKYTPAGEYIGLLGVESQFKNPRGLALFTPKQGSDTCVSPVEHTRILVAEQFRLQVVRLDGEPLQVVQIALARSLWGVCVEGDKVFLADQGTRSLHTLRIRDPTHPDTPIPV